MKSFTIIFACLICLSFYGISSAQTQVEEGYSFLANGDTTMAIDRFENYVQSNYYDYQIQMQLGYIYKSQHKLNLAYNKFDFVSKNSSDPSQADIAKREIAYLNDQMNHPQESAASPKSDLDSAYLYMNAGNTRRAAEKFETYLASNPTDSKVHLQLGYIYYAQNKLDQALRHFDYAAKHSLDPSDVETARSAVLTIREQRAYYAKSSLDLYLYSYYDTFQENFISNFVGHYNYKINPRLYTGLYLDVYTDTRSKPGIIFNDRFVEIGGFLRYHLMDNLFFENRIGYVTEIDSHKSSINLKALLVYFNRFGEGRNYVGRNAASKTSLFLDIYYAAMYDYKFRNAFLQGSFQEVLRFHTGGYSYFDNYLVQYAQFDSRKLDYNNYFEVGAGIRYHPNIMYFPTIFVEPTYKIYFFGNKPGTIQNSFQVKAGLQFIFRTKL